MRRRLSTVALLTLAWSAVGCSALLDTGPTNRCRSDADCTAGTCDADRGMCVAAPRTPLMVGFEVLPSSDPIYAGSVRTYSFEPIPVAESIEDHSLPLSPGIPVLGFATDGLGQPITADISFSTSSLIPGGPSASASVPSRADALRDSREGFDYNFATQLLPGRDYDVTVRPTGEWASRLPPRSFPIYRTPEADSHRLELRYPEPCPAAVINDPTSTASCLATIEGFVRDAAGNPVDGVSVRAVDPVNGQTLSSTYTTGSGTEPVPGRFQVVLPVERWRDQEGWLFRVTPTSARLEEHGPSQSFTVAPSALYEDDLGVVTILTPSVPNIVEYAGWVEGPTPDVVARNANLQFVSRNVVDETTGAVGSFTATAATDDEGLFQVTLLAGSYDVVITPAQSDPGQTQLGVLYVQERRIDPTPPEGFSPADHIPVMGQLFSLPERNVLNGTVRTAGGEGMIGATVRAQARGTDLGGELPMVARYARSNMSMSDVNGMFAVGVDIGVYDIVVEPPSGSNYPWRVRSDQPIAANVPNTYDLENPVVVSGVAAFEDPVGGHPIPVANGEVRAYAVIEAPGGGTRAVQIGRTSTDADGNYTLLLPPSIQ